MDSPPRHFANLQLVPLRLASVELERIVRRLSDEPEYAKSVLRGVAKLCQADPTKLREIPGNRWARIALNLRHVVLYRQEPKRSAAVTPEAVPIATSCRTKDGSDKQPAGLTFHEYY